MSSPNLNTKLNLESESKRKFHIDTSKLFYLVLGVVFMGAVYIILPDGTSQSARMMISLLVVGVFYWTFEPIPLGVTAVLLMVLMLVFDVVSTEVVYSGFASPAVLLIIAGMMMARGVNDTLLAKRLAYLILAKWGGTAKGLLGSILVIPQIQALFIPAAAVRTTLLLPVAQMALNTIGEKGKGNLRRMILLGVAFGGTISGTAIMTAAIGNILTVELLKEFLGVQITYIQWFLYTFPIWLILIPITWFTLIKLCPLSKENNEFPHVKEKMVKKLEELGKMDFREKKCLAILLFIVGLWLTEPLHGLHPSIPALLGVILMALPGIGCSKWENMVKINFDTVIILAVTLSLGYAFNESGSAKVIGDSLSAAWMIDLLRSPIIAVFTILILSQLLHLVVANVSTAVVTLIPIFIGLSSQAGADPILISITASLACLHGYILVVESMPNVIVHSSGQIQQKEFLLPGFILTIAMILVTAFTAITWWNWIGFL